MSYKIIVTGSYNYGFVYDEFFLPEHKTEYDEFVKDLKELKTFITDLKIKEKRVATKIGYKKAQDNLIIKLAILAGKNNEHRTNVKIKDTAMYRCSKALVLNIYDCHDRNQTKNQASSIYDPNFLYNRGQIVEINDYDENDEEMCTKKVHNNTTNGVKGIYYFLNEECAKMWYIANPNFTGYYTGPFKRWFDDGVIDECGEYVNGLKHGEWLFYDCNHKCYFSNGVRISSELLVQD